MAVERGFLGFGKELNGTQRNKLRKVSKKFVDNKLVVDLENAFNEIGLSGHFRIDNPPTKESDKDPAEFFIEYNSVLPGAGAFSFQARPGKDEKIYQTYSNPRNGYSPVLIFGAGDLGQIAFNVLENDVLSHIKVTGFIDDKKVLEGKELSGKQIYTEKQAFKRFIATGEIKEIILAISKKRIEPNRKKEFLGHCVQYGVKVREIPPIKDWIGGKFSSRQIRDINIEDLLGRDPIWLNQKEVSKDLKNAVVLVPGAAGSIGSETVRQLMSFESRKVILLDQAELVRRMKKLVPEYISKNSEYSKFDEVTA